MARFNGSTAFLSNSAPGLASGGYPLSVGFWFNASSFPFDYIFAFIDTSGATTHRLAVQVDGSGFVGIEGRTNASSTTSTTGVVSAETPNFGFAQFFSDTNRRLSMLFANGATEHVQNTVSRVPVGLDQIRIGGAGNLAGGLIGPFAGLIDEIWWADTAIQADGAQLSDALLRQLAFGGPFSVPHIRKNIVEYHALRSSLPSAMSAPEEHYWRGAKPTWTNNGGVGLGPHSPARQENPNSRASLVMI